MTSRPIDAPLLELTDPTVARPLPGELAEARSALVAATTEFLSVPESALTDAWRWIGGSEEEVRYGAYRAAEALEQAETEARSLVAADDAAETRAARIIGSATAARWDLCGLLLPLADGQLDADPGGGEWTIRLVMGHVISAQRAYGWGSAWWLANPHDAADPGLPEGAAESLWEVLPDEATTEAHGTGADLRARLDGVLDLGAERLAAVADERLDQGARWSGFPVTIGFRLGRWSSHIREHTIQVEKTLVALNHVPGEPQRLARHVLAAYGRAEAAVFGRAPTDGVAEAVRRIGRGTAEAREALTSALEAATRP
jgi:hypothetical protein